jgi:E3 ubiquitin-protein ligase listerin
LGTEGYFVTDDSFDTLFQQVVTTFGEDLSRILHGEDEDVAKLNVLVDIIAVCVETRISLVLDESVALSLVPDIFALAFLLPKALSVPDIPVAQNIWLSWLANAPTGLQRQVGAAICARLQDAIFHTSILVRCDPFTHREMFTAYSFEESPLDILQATAGGGIDRLVSGLDDLLPTSTYLDDLLCNLRLDPATASLAIIQPLIPPTSSFETAEGPDCEGDQQGLGVYARGVMALLYSYTENRDLARTNLWALRHFLALAIYAEELLEVPSLPNPAFSRTVTKDVLQDVLIKVQQLTAYLLTTAGTDDGWHVDVVKSLLNGKRNASLGNLAAFTVDLMQWAQDEDDSLHARIFYTILQHALRDASKEEADEWLLLARKLERNSKSIVFCIHGIVPI